MGVGPSRVGLNISVVVRVDEREATRTREDLPFGFQADMMILLSVGLFLIVSITLAN